MADIAAPTHFKYSEAVHTMKAAKNFYNANPLIEMIIMENRMDFKIPDRMKIAIGTDVSFKCGGYSFIVVVGRSDDGKLYLLNVDYGTYNFNEIVDMAITVYQKWNKPMTPVVRFGIEATMYHESLRQHLRKETAIPTVRVEKKLSKSVRFRNLNALLASGKLKFPETETSLETISDDLFDALEMAVGLAEESGEYRDIFQNRKPDLAPEPA